MHGLCETKGVASLVAQSNSAKRTPTGIYDKTSVQKVRDFLWRRVALPHRIGMALAPRPPLILWPPSWSSPMAQNRRWVMNGFRYGRRQTRTCETIRHAGWARLFSPAGAAQVEGCTASANPELVSPRPLANLFLYVRTLMKIDLKSLVMGAVAPAYLIRVAGVTTKATRTRGLVLICCWLAFTVLIPRAYGQGTLNWHWNFDQSNYIVGPSDSIHLTATIFIRPDSPASFTGRVSITFQGSLFSLYDLDCGFCRDPRLRNVNLAPGESFPFTFGTLTPKSPIAPGTYRNMPDQPLLSFLSLTTHRSLDTPLVIQVVPEPSTLILGLLGMLSFCGWSFFKRK
jgi:hypothetical protein